MTEEDIEIRPATIEDVDAFIDLQKESRAYHEELDSRFRFAYAPDADDSMKAYFTKQCESDMAWTGLAFHDGSLIGYIEAVIRERPPIFVTRTIGFIEGLYLKSETRGKGIGSRLWNMAFDWLKEHEVTKIRLWVAVKNPLAVEFWGAKGFSEVSRVLERDLDS
ncbi:MAG: N-acetyltransferase family protein [Candidatus Thorarchaeota archaeon]|jgi:aminoglycoside 6'-N-acetyltransferase I